MSHADRSTRLRRSQRHCALVFVASILVLGLSLLTLTKPRPQVPLQAAASAPTESATIEPRRPLVAAVAIGSLITGGASLVGLVVLWGLGKRARGNQDPRGDRPVDS
jgi:hypothetical protein